MVHIFSKIDYLFSRYDTIVHYNMTFRIAVTADAQAFVTKFQEMNSTNDVLRGLDNIGENAKEFFRLGQPLRKLIQTFNATGQVSLILISYE